MSRRVRRRTAQTGKIENVGFPASDEDSTLAEKKVLDWTRLPDDTVIQLFSRLNYCDRATLSSTCRAWRALSKSTCLWKSLDLRAHKCDNAATLALASRCKNLEKIRFRGPESADAIINLQAKNLKEISGESCTKVTDATVIALVARHEALECIQLGPNFCNGITSESIKVMAICCPKLKKLWIWGMAKVHGNAINALAKNCKNLIDIGFIECGKVDETALGNVRSLRFLSVQGTTSIKWNLVAEKWTKLPFLIGLDVSRTNISPNIISSFFSSSSSLKVLCALNCVALEKDATFVLNNNNKGKVLLDVFTNIVEVVVSLFIDTPKENDGNNIFRQWNNFSRKDKKLDAMLNWLEWIISDSLLCISVRKPSGLDNFWFKQSTGLWLSLMQSSQEEVQERAVGALAKFVFNDDKRDSVAEVFIPDGGIDLLLNLAQSWQEGLQSIAPRAIRNLSRNDKVAEALSEGGGINILVNLAISFSRLVAEEAAGGLWSLSFFEEHDGAIADVGGLKALVDLIFKWSKSTGGERILEGAAGALANLAMNDRCSIEISSVAGVLDALVQLTHSPHDGVKEQAAAALWNLSTDDTNREAIAAVGGVEALVALARSSSNASCSLQTMAAGALWGLSESEEISIAIGRGGGVAPLIALAQSDVENVHETAAGALWNLAFNPGNALRIIEEGGVSVLVHLCSSKSKKARLISALVLSYMCDGRMDEITLIGTSIEGSSMSVNIYDARRMALKHIEAFVMSFCDPQAFATAASSSAPAALAQVIESVRIQEAGQLSLCEAEIGRFVAMLRNPCPTLKSCAAFALLQFTLPGGQHAGNNVSLLHNTEAPRVLHVIAAALGARIEAKIFARIVLRNLEQHHMEPLL